MVVNTNDAATVRLIFTRYLELGSVHALERNLTKQGIVSKIVTSSKGRSRGGVPFSRGALFHLLRNRIYLGEIVHGTLVHPGLHDAIVDRALFNAVQQQLDINRRRHATSLSEHRAALAGKLVDATGAPLTPTMSKGHAGKSYRYYVSASLQQGRRTADAIRVAAPAFEDLIRTMTARLTGCSQADALAIVVRVELHRSAAHLLVPVRHLAHARDRLLPDEQAARDDADPSLARLVVSVSSQLRGGRTHVTSTGAVPPRRDAVLIAALRRAHKLITTDKDGMPGLKTAPGSPYQRRLVRLALLAPDIQRAIIDGRQPRGLTLAQLMKIDMPLDWEAQRAAFV
jgi:site-specific DNA recombinase